MDAILTHEPFDALLAGGEASQPQFTHHAWTAISALEFSMNGTNHGQHLIVRQPSAIRLAAPLPRSVAADANVEHYTHFKQHKRLDMRSNSGVLHRTSRAKYAAAFFMISFSRVRRATSERSRDSSIASGVTTLQPAPVSLPAAAALIQLRRLWLLRPSSFAASVIVCPSLTRLTASSLNSAVYACFGIFFISSLSKVTSILRHLWKAKFRGKLTFLIKTF